VTKYIDGNEESVTGNIPDWSFECKVAATLTGFISFREKQIFLEVVEGTPFHGGLYNLKRLLKDSNFIKSLPDIAMSDQYGNPANKIEFTDYENRVWHLNPTTLRYANNACNVLRLFGGAIANLNVYEIGGGYGGESKIFQDVWKKSSNKISWNIFDLESSYGIITKWLSTFGYSTKFLNIKDLFNISNNALVISCGALSEMRGSLLQNYIEKVVLKARYGYLITNFETHSKPFGGYSTNEFINYLKSNGKADVIELDAGSWLSYFDFKAGSKLIIFGHGHLRNISGRNFKDIIFYKLIEKLRAIEFKLTRAWLDN
jgi:hypothetical protein